MRKFLSCALLAGSSGLAACAYQPVPAPAPAAVAANGHVCATGSIDANNDGAVTAAEWNGWRASGFGYWDMNDETRAFSKRFLAKVGHMPTMIQAGLYSATMHYLKAIEAIGTDEAPKVMEQMRKTPVNDFFAKNGKIRIDGRMVHDMYLFQVKKPQESKGEWDLYKLLATVPGDQAFRPLDKGGCPLVKKG